MHKNWQLIELSGLDEETIQTIERTLKAVPNIEQAFLFGSRAMENYKPASDIDIVLKGKDAAGSVTILRTMLEYAPRFPYKVDVVHYESIASRPELKDHIDHYGRRIF